jgi:hypothetical protein
MRSWKRLAFYLLLNIAVSAATTLAVLSYWDNGRLLRPAGESTPRPPAAAVTSRPAETSRPAAPRPTAAEGIGGQQAIRIQSVVGAGDLVNETVILALSGEGEISLEGWSLEDDQGNRYVFPQLLLNTGGQVTVHSARGMDTATDLYWGRGATIWQSGTVISLLDPGGSLNAAYTIP